MTVALGHFAELIIRAQINFDRFDDHLRIGSPIHLGQIAIRDMPRIVLRVGLQIGHRRNSAIRSRLRSGAAGKQRAAEKER